MIFFKLIFKKIIGFFSIQKIGIIKFGIDPTFYSIHLGHFFIINFLFFLIKKNFNIIVIIGDYTTFLKKKINKKIIIMNSICLKSQIYNIIGEINIFFNSIWIINNKLSFFLKIFDLINTNKYICKSIKNENQEKINIKKLLYPLIQAYDSLIINSYIEIGGIDQLLNIICARFIQKIFKKLKQNSILFILLENENKKISKSDNNDLIVSKLSKTLINLVFYNIKTYIEKLFIINCYKFIFFKLKKNNFYFKKRNFLSYYYKKIFKNNKFFFNNKIYKKNIFINNKLLINNFFLKKINYNFLNIKIKLYD
ncbi:hypothetical protein [Candidatus Carsonella ruddii]|uniref:hypothetical protein n=1 Tax=Carsonella ruddii TaxID=114186 RepID=UPI003D8185AC